MTTQPRRLVFAHANGFPAGTYRKLFGVWRAAGYAVSAPDKLGHDPRFPPGGNWRRLADHLAEYVQASGPGPAALVGHSLGGLLALMVACQRPALANAVVILDAPIVTGWRAQTVRLLKCLGVMHRFSPAGVAVRRRTRWATRADALAHFASKPVFARWDPEVLADYVDAGIDDLDGEAALAFDRDIEGRIYDTLPHHLGPLLRDQPPRCPVAFIAGTQSAELRSGGTGPARALAGPHFVWMEGTHLYPMEKPEATAQQVLDLLTAMGQ